MPKLLAAWVGGQQVEASSSLRGDSLWVQLPPPVVKRDSVNIAFTTRVFASPTVFETFVFNSSQEDNGQGVVPAELGADQVFVPEVVQGASLIRNLRHSELFTPNGDAVNDLYELSFTVVKTDKAAARARLFSRRSPNRRVGKRHSTRCPGDVRLGRPAQRRDRAAGHLHSALSGCKPILKTRSSSTTFTSFY